MGFFNSKILDTQKNKDKKNNVCFCQTTVFTVKILSLLFEFYQFKKQQIDIFSQKKTL